MCTDADSTTLIRFLQQLGCTDSTLRPHRVVVLLREARDTLQCRKDECRRRQLRLAVTDLLLVQCERLHTSTAALSDPQTIRSEVLNC